MCEGRLDGQLEGSVPKGYKQTEVGVIPEDWEVQQLGELANIYRGASPRPIESPIWFDDYSSVGWVRISDVTKSGRRLTFTTQRLSKLGINHSRFVPKNSLIMSICATVGRPIITDIDVCIHDGFVVFENPIVSKEYLYYILASLESVWSKAGQTGSQMNLNTGIINPKKIALPTSQLEQQAIAEALSDADAMIEGLEALISKKQQVRQGTMRELMKPNTSWVENLLGTTATLKARIGWQGLTTNEYLDNGYYYLVTGTDFDNGRIDWTNCHYIDEKRYKQDINIQLRPHDVLITKDGTIGKVAFIDKLDKPATLNSGVFVVRPIGHAFHPAFFFYLLRSQVFIDFLNQLSAGSTINHLYQKDFVKFSYKAPSVLDEQKYIADILLNIDKEIEGLEEKLAKAKQLKEGMMQDLLTGKVRLL